MASSNVIESTDQSFEEDVLKSELPVLVDFWAAWCGPCRAIAPAIDQIAEELAGKVRVVKVDAQNNMATARANNVANLPTFLVFKGGKEVHRKIGTGGGKAALLKLAESAI